MPRLDGIDTLRGLSILAVILLHIWIRFLIVTSVNLGRSWPPIWRSLVWHNGGNGVTVFFAISGFLITLTSLRRFGSLGRLQPTRFYRVRFARIIPLLLLLLAGLSILHLACVQNFRMDTRVFTLPRALFSALTFHLNWLEAARNKFLPPCWTVLWSLSIEEMFYLFFPLACLLLLRWRRAGVALWFALALTLVAMGPFARTVWSHTDLQQENSYLAGMSDIAMGCMAAWLTGWAIRTARVPRRRTLLLMRFAGALPLVWFSTWPRWMWLRPASRLIGRSGVDDTLLALGVSLIAASVALAPRHGPAWLAPLRWFGRHSYELYLAHEFVVLLAVDVVFVHRFPHAEASRATLALIVLGALLTCAPLAWALARFFSEPMNRWLRGASLPI